MKRILLLTSMILALGVSCSRETLVLPEILLNQVSDIKTYSLDRKIRLVFKAYNNETGFIGYNIYVGTQVGLVPSSKIVMSSPYVSLPAYSSNPNTIYSIDLTNNSFSTPLVNKKKYYVTVNAANYLDGKDKDGPASPTSVCTPLTNYSFYLYDHQLSGQTNIGFKLMPDGTPVRSDMVDGVYLEVRSNSYTPSLYLCVSNSSTFIQDVGSASGIESRNPVPRYPQGYGNTNTQQSACLVLAGHIYSFYDSSKLLYGKIFTETLPGTIVTGSFSTKLQVKVVVHAFPNDVDF